MIGRVAGGHLGRLVATRKTHGRAPRFESPLTTLGLKSPWSCDSVHNIHAYKSNHSLVSVTKCCLSRCRMASVMIKYSHIWMMDTALTKQSDVLFQLHGHSPYMLLQLRVKKKDHRLQYKIRILYPVTLLLEDLSTEYGTLGAKIVSLVVLVKAFPSGAWIYVAWICFTKRLQAQRYTVY